ncbi:protein phosphatase 2C domain-containing protein [Streptomyces sp. NPDC055089]
MRRRFFDYDSGPDDGFESGHDPRAGGARRPAAPEGASTRWTTGQVLGGRNPAGPGDSSARRLGAPSPQHSRSRRRPRWRPAGVAGWLTAVVATLSGGIMAGRIGAMVGLAAGAATGYLVREVVNAFTTRKQDEQDPPELPAGRPPQTGPSAGTAPAPWTAGDGVDPHRQHPTTAPAPLAGEVEQQETVAAGAQPTASVVHPALPPARTAAHPPPPVMYQGSQLTELPWRLPAQPAPPGMAADSARVGDLEVRAASVVGAGHRIDETNASPRQDAYRVGRDAASRHLVVAVADGMSDSPHSDTAAAVAALALVNALRRQLDEGVPLLRLDHASAFLEAAGQVHAVARQRHWPADTVRTVATAAVVPAAAGPDGGRDLWLAGLGDTTAWVRRPQRWSLKLGDKQRGLDAGRLDAYLPHTPEAVRRQLVRLAPGDVLALTSDGVGDALTDLPEAHDWFHRQWASPVSAFELLLHINYDSHQRNDDRTAVVVWPWPREGGRR